MFAFPTVNITNNSGHPWKAEIDVYKYLINSPDQCTLLINMGRSQGTRPNEAILLQHELLDVSICVLFYDTPEDLRQLLQRRIQVIKDFHQTKTKSRSSNLHPIVRSITRP